MMTLLIDGDIALALGLGRIRSSSSRDLYSTCLQALCTCFRALHPARRVMSEGKYVPIHIHTDRTICARVAKVDTVKLKLLCGTHCYIGTTMGHPPPGFSTVSFVRLHKTYDRLCRYQLSRIPPTSIPRLFATYM